MVVCVRLIIGGDRGRERGRQGQEVSALTDITVYLPRKNYTKADRSRARAEVRQVQVPKRLLYFKQVDIRESQRFYTGLPMKLSFSERRLVKYLL